MMFGITLFFGLCTAFSSVFSIALVLGCIIEDTERTKAGEKSYLSGQRSMPTSFKILTFFSIMTFVFSIAFIVSLVIMSPLT